jgi:hypothetical protein
VRHASSACNSSSCHCTVSLSRITGQTHEADVGDVGGQALVRRHNQRMRREHPPSAAVAHQPGQSVPIGARVATRVQPNLVSLPACDTCSVLHRSLDKTLACTPLSRNAKPSMSMSVSGSPAHLVEQGSEAFRVSRRTRASSGSPAPSRGRACASLAAPAAARGQCPAAWQSRPRCLSGPVAATAEAPRSSLGARRPP